MKIKTYLSGAEFSGPARDHRTGSSLLEKGTEIASELNLEPLLLIKVEDQHVLVDKTIL